MNQLFHLGARCARVCCALAVVVAGSVVSLRTDLQQANAAPILFAEPFTGRSTSGWVAGGNKPACLTAGYASGDIPACTPGDAGGIANVLPDPDGFGALRLTNNKLRQAGYVFYNANIQTGNGLDVTFDYYSYGGSGGDGLSFILIDGSVNPTQPGGSGGSLGYAPLIAPDQQINQLGIAGGFLAIGLDEFGNFVNSQEGRGAGCAPSPFDNERFPNSVTVRGSAGVGGSISPAPGTQGYCMLQTSGTLSQSLAAASPVRTVEGRRQVRIVLDVNGNLEVSIDFGAGFVAVLPKLALNSIPGQPMMPGTVKLAFAASTGEFTNIHEVRNLVVRADRTGVRITKSHSGDFANGQQGTYRIEVANRGTLPTLPGEAALITDTLPAGLTYADGTCAGAGWVCTGAGQLLTASYAPGAGNVITAGQTLPVLTFNVNVDSAQSVITNTASATMLFNSGVDGDTVNDITLVRAPNLMVRAGIATGVQLGRTVIFTTEVINEGSLAASDVTVTQTVKGPLNIQSVQAAGGGVWSCTATPMPRCATPRLAASSRAVMTVTATVDVTGVNSVDVSSASSASTSVREIGAGANAANSTATVLTRFPTHLPIIIR